MNPTTDSHNDEPHIENQKVPLPMFNYQEPEFTNHHGSAPQISVTESTPETQRKGLPLQLQVPSDSACSSDTTTVFTNEGEKLADVISLGQRGRMEDQRCSLDPSKSAPCSPQNTERKSTASSSSGLDSEAFMTLLSNSQSRRMDDQRVSLPSLPGLDNDKASSTANPESNYLCYMVSKVQGSRMDDQRCSLPQIVTTQKSPQDDSSERARSASLCTNADIHPSNSKKSANPAEQDVFFKMISHAQQRRMEDQRCELKPSPKSDRKETQPDKLPNDASYLCYMVSKVQGSRMDEQRCSAPFIFQNMSPSFQRKDSEKTRQRSASLTPDQTTQRPEISGAQEEQFLKMMKHAQKGRMEEQRCSLPSSTPASPKHNGSALTNKPLGADTDAFFRTIATSQSRRLDDQRAELPAIPRTSETKKQNDFQRQNALYRKDSFSKSAPQITVTQSTPTSSRREFLRPVSQLETGHDSSTGQVTVRVSMSFSSLQGLASQEQPGQFPELFLTLGAPGDNLMIPLSPVPGRRLSLSLNLVPKEDGDFEQASPIHPSPKKSRSGQSSPQDDHMLVAVTQTIKGQTTPIKKGHKQKGKAKDKSTQEKGKKTAKKDKTGSKR